MKEYEPEVAKVVRKNHRGIQKVKTHELVPGDIVEVSGTYEFGLRIGQWTPLNFVFNFTHLAGLLLRCIYASETKSYRDLR